VQPSRRIGKPLGIGAPRRSPTFGPRRGVGFQSRTFRTPFGSAARTAADGAPRPASATPHRCARGSKKRILLPL